MQQGSLLSIIDSAPPTAGLIGVWPAIRAQMNRAANAYPEGRKILVDRINETAKREGISLTSGGGKIVSLELLNKWLQPQDKEHIPKLEAVLCFCVATRDHSPLIPIFAAMNLTVIPANDLSFLEYGKACDALKKTKDYKKKLEARL